MSKITPQRAAELAEKDLLKALAQGDSSFVALGDLISKYRCACESFAFSDLVRAHARNIESRLWSAHGKINSRYRSALAKLHVPSGKERPVERRKLEKEYLRFIKTAAQYYRCHVHRLATHYKSPIKVLEVARILEPECLATTEFSSLDPTVDELVVDSCHRALVQLGDLSRYRETEVPSKKRNWQPAKAYYGLASLLKPNSGFSHNQLAVIARIDGDHLSALYHLYRALSVNDPYPRAEENLKTELKKLISFKDRALVRYHEGHLSSGLDANTVSVCLHAQLHTDQLAAHHGELENEALSHLLVETKERSEAGFLTKFCLSAIAAQHLLSNHKQTRLDRLNNQAFVSFLSLNLKTFLILIRGLLLEIEVEPAVPKFEMGTCSTDGRQIFSRTFKRIAPSLRHYSTWLLSNASQLVAWKNHDRLKNDLTEFWRAYAHALTLLRLTFPTSRTTQLDYLLEEDEDTIAFTPFENYTTRIRFCQADGRTSRTRPRREGIDRECPNDEMLYRIRGLLEDGFTLVKQSTKSDAYAIPLLFRSSQFEFREDRGSPKLRYGGGYCQPQSSRDGVELARHRSSAAVTTEAVAENVSD